MQANCTDEQAATCQWRLAEEAAIRKIVGPGGGLRVGKRAGIPARRAP
jgi:hypothetical protein